MAPYGLTSHTIKDIDWRTAGKYLVSAKYIYLQSNPDGQESLTDLGKNITKIAEETDIKHLPDYAPPNLKTLSGKEIDIAKSNLVSGSMPYQKTISRRVNRYLGLRRIVDQGNHAGWKYADESNSQETRLFGNIYWEFRHGTSPIFARISDEVWLERYQKEREFDIRPGDALSCRVTVECSYGYDNELIRTSYVVEKVEQVLGNQISIQGRLLD